MTATDYDKNCNTAQQPITLSNAKNKASQCVARNLRIDFNEAANIFIKKNDRRKEREKNTMKTAANAIFPVRKLRHIMSQINVLSQSLIHDARRYVCVRWVRCRKTSLNLFAKIQKKNHRYIFYIIMVEFKLSTYLRRFANRIVAVRVALAEGIAEIERLLSPFRPID